MKGIRNKGKTARRHTARHTPAKKRQQSGFSAKLSALALNGRAKREAAKPEKPAASAAIPAEPSVPTFQEVPDIYSQYFRNIAQFPLLTPVQEKRLARKKDREALINSNLRLVVSIAKGYAMPGTLLIDLINEGNIGLMKAVERFKTNMGARLSTYASWWIHQAIRRHIANQMKAVRLPVHVQEKIQKIQKANATLMAELKREPTDEELAELTGLDEDFVSIWRSGGIRMVCLDAPVNGDVNSARIGDLIPDPQQESPEQTTQDIRQDLEQFISRLSQREQVVIRQRFGWEKGKSRTLEEIGQDYDLTRERIRQIEFKALKKLRKMFERRKSLQRIQHLLPAETKSVETPAVSTLDAKSSPASAQTHPGTARVVIVPLAGDPPAKAA